MMRIMINNINVADCEFLGYCNICKLKSGSNCPIDCKENPNCYYKNWQRKEQECEELKDLNTRLDNQRETYWKEYQKLKQTFTEIKEIIHFNKTNRLSGGADISIEQILQKISECEVDDE